MARPQKYNLQYFPLDVDFFNNHKTLMIEEDFGVKGGYIAIRLMAMVYEKGYYLEWKNNSELSCAKRVGNGFTGALVGEILKSCLKHGLFSQRLFNEFGILTSAGIQERWLQVMQQLRRKSEIDVRFILVSSEETKVNDEEMTSPATESTQKERKVNEKKEKKFLPGKPVAKKSKKNKDKKKEKEVEPHWPALVKVWFDFNKENFGDEPSFEKDDPRIMKRIIGRLKKRAADKNIEWTQDAAIERWKSFLVKCHQDLWLGTHFLLSNLENQFDTIILNHKQNGQSKHTGISKTAGIEHAINSALSEQDAGGN